MNDNLSIAQQCGQRCKRSRLARGWTQARLADEFGTSSQNISKFEINGISDIDTIKKLSQVLGQDLLLDTNEEEGTIGEIGKEILLALIEHSGYMDFETMNSGYLHGMSAERASNEVLKLHRIGLIEREFLEDWSDDKRDELFITSKGIISVKHLCPNHIDEDSLKNIVSYEELIGDYNSYQEYINDHFEERLIRRFSLHNIAPYEHNRFRIKTCYQSGFIEYLKKNYISAFENNYYCVDEDDTSRLNPHSGIFHDILYRMALHISNDILWDHALCGDDMWDYEHEESQLCEKIFGTDPMSHDKVFSNTKDRFVEEFSSILENDYQGFDDDNDDEHIGSNSSESKRFVSKILNRVADSMRIFVDTVFSKSDTDAEETRFEEAGSVKEFLNHMSESHKYVEDALNKAEAIPAEEKKRYLKLNDWSNMNLFFEIMPLDELLKYYRPEGASPLPFDWFTKEEITQFITENIISNNTDYEQQVDELLSVIVKRYPDALHYFDMPAIWKENGIAEYIYNHTSFLQDNE